MGVWTEKEYRYKYHMEKWRKNRIPIQLYPEMGCKELAAPILHTCVLYNVAWLLFFYYRPLTMSLLAPSCQPCSRLYWVVRFCVVKNNIRAASSRDIHSYGFSMQPAISSHIIGNVRRSFELVAEVPLRVLLYPCSCAVDARVVLSWLSYSPPPARAARVGLREDPNSDLPQE